MYRNQPFRVDSSDRYGRELDRPFRIDIVIGMRTHWNRSIDDNITIIGCAAVFRMVRTKPA